MIQPLTRPVLKSRTVLILLGLSICGVLSLRDLSAWQGSEKITPRPGPNKANEGANSAWPSGAPAGPEHASFYWNTFGPDEKTIQETRWKSKPGCSCATDDPELPAELRTLPVSPSTAVIGRNEPLQLRYDASFLCNGQTARSLDGKSLERTSDTAGTVKWSAAAEQNVPALNGWLSFSGYPDSGKYNVSIEIKVHCYDPSPACKQPKHFSVCSLKTKVPVTVVKRK